MVRLGRVWEREGRTPWSVAVQKLNNAYGYCRDNLGPLSPFSSDGPILFVCLFVLEKRSPPPTPALDELNLRGRECMWFSGVPQGKESIEIIHCLFHILWLNKVTACSDKSFYVYFVEIRSLGLLKIIIFNRGVLGLFFFCPPIYSSSPVLVLYGVLFYPVRILILCLRSCA